MEKKRIGFGKVGTLVIIYQFLAYMGYCCFQNFPQNVMSQYYGGTTTTTFMNLLSSLLGFIINYFILAPRIGKVKSIRKLAAVFGVIALAFCAGVTFTPPTMPALWCVMFILCVLTCTLWMGFGGIIIGNWFPRRKGTVMGIVTIAFPLVTGIGLSLFYGIWYGEFGKQMAMTQGNLAKAAVSANLKAFLPYWIAALIGVLICIIFLRDYPEQCGEYRDNDPSMTAEEAKKMMMAELEARKRSVWTRSKIWGCKDYWMNSIPSGLLLTCAIAFMVQIIPVLNVYAEDLAFLAVPSFVLMSTGVNTILFFLSIFASVGSWVLGVIDTKYGTKTAVFITSILMLLSGLLGLVDNVWCVVASTWILGLFMGASSNFGISGLVRYWRAEDFPAISYGAPPVGTIIGSAMPWIIALLGSSAMGYKAAFGFVAIMAVICIIMNRLFNPRGIIAYDNKLRAAAGLPIDDVLEQRLKREHK